ncbi:MAG: amino acid permease [Gammaproteobacteria bacterium]
MTEQTVLAPPPVKNRGKLGLWMLTALVAGNMIGSGIFLLPAALAHFGSISILGWIISAFGAICLALVFANLSKQMPRTGGPYVYCRAAFGDFIGFQVAYNYWLYICVGTAGIAVAFAGYVGVFWPGLMTDPVLSFFFKAGTVWVLTLISIFGVREAGIVQLVATVLKILPLLLVGVVGLFFMRTENLGQFNISGTSDFAALTGAATLTLWAFTGLESATVPADEVDHPRNIARATIGGTVIAAVIYILSTVSIMGLISPAELKNSTAPYADAAKLIFGPTWGWLITAGAIISCFGALNGWILLQGQVPLAAARDNLFPRIFAQESKNQTPVFGLLFSSLLITALLALTLNQGLVKQFTFITLLATLAVLIPYFFSTMAELMMFIKNREQFQGQRLFKSVIITLIAGAYSFWAMIGAGQEVVFYGGLLFLSGIPVYVWVQWQGAAR